MLTLTKYTEDTLCHEINEVLDRQEARGEALQPQWVTHEVCRQHRAGLVSESEHAAFWEFGGYTITRKLATRCINERGDAAAAEPTRTPMLPGFEYLQRYYVMTRNGVDVGVPTDQCTDDELLGKAMLYRAQSIHLIAHADEIERYVAIRQAERGLFAE